MELTFERGPRLLHARGVAGKGHILFTISPTTTNTLCVETRLTGFPPRTWVEFRDRKHECGLDWASTPQGYQEAAERCRTMLTDWARDVLGVELDVTLVTPWATTEG